jgi:hypothetical protein
MSGLWPPSDEPDEAGVHEEGKSEVVHLVRESLEPGRHDCHTAEPESHQCNYKANTFKFVLLLENRGLFAIFLSVYCSFQVFFFFKFRSP